MRTRTHVGSGCDIDAGPAEAGDIGALGASRDLHGRDDRVSGRLYDLARFPEFLVDRQAVLCGPCELREADIRWRVLARALGHDRALCAVAGAPARLRRLVSAGAVPRQAPAGTCAFAVHLALHDAA